jgi:UDP-N-acetylmuramoyl-tripeptide--D-alanyl-D-alanine ligase
VGEEAATLRIDQLITIGQMGKIIAKTAEKAGLEKSVAVGSTTEAAHLLGEIAAPGDLVLIKGSRLARTERVLEEFGKYQPMEDARR